jgi:hypothetical protein
MIDTVEWLREASEGLDRLATQPRAESIEDNVQLVADCQSLINRLQAVQSVAMANVTAIDDVVDSSTGEVTEQFRGYDHHRMDAAALVNDELGMTTRAAEGRVGVAAALAHRYPTVLQAMGHGRIDAHRASIIEHELADAPDDTVEAVLATIEPYLGTETGGRLRQRVRRALGQVAAEFLRQKAAQARRDRSLQRWPGTEPGVDTWTASLPVEQSAKAWSAIDTLAREYVRTGQNSCIEQARADAMLAFIDGNARAEYVIQVAVPESRLNGALASVTEPQTPPHTTGQPAPAAKLPGAATEQVADAAAAPAQNAADLVDTADLDAWVRQVLRDTGIGQACTITGPPALTGPPTQTIPEDRSADGKGDTKGTGKGKNRKRKQLRAADASSAAATAGLLRPIGLPTLAPRRVRIDILPCDESTGAYSSTPVSSWTITPTSQDQAGRGSDHATATAATSRNGNAGSTGNVDSTGVAGLEAAFATAMVRRCAAPEPVVIGYRPTEAMIRTVKGRDGHCRFPGCTVAATFCDLDHVTPWREGSTLTQVSNLICLCRRHHRTKQLRRWTVRTLPGAVVEWTDPTGRQRLTHPVHHLNPDPQPWLNDDGRPLPDDTGATPDRPIELPSLLEEAFEYLTDHRERFGPQHRNLFDEYGKRIGQLITPGSLWTVDLTDDYATHLASRRTTGRRRSNADDPPPF